MSDDVAPFFHRIFPLKLVIQLTPQMTRHVNMILKQTTILFASSIHLPSHSHRVYLRSSIHTGRTYSWGKRTRSRSRFPTITIPPPTTTMILSFISTAAKTAPIPTAFALISAMETVVTIVMRKMQPKIPAEAADIFSPAIAAGLSAFYYLNGRRGFRQSTFLLIVATWAIRLSSFSYARIRHGYHDSRLDKFRDQSGARFWLVMHSLWIFLSPLPIWVAMTAKDGLPISQIDFALAALSASGLVMETLADIQKAAFRAENNAKPKLQRQKFCENGLYRFSRFPNYFGEWLIWTSLSGLAFRATKSWTRFLLPLSPVFTYTVLQVSMKIAIASVKKRCSAEELKRWESISMFVPLLRRR